MDKGNELKIRVGPFDYDVVFEDAEIFEDGTEPVIGCVSHNRLQMRIGGRCAPERVFVTLWHEALHAVSSVWSVGLSEEQVDKLAHGIVMMLRDNETLRWMKDDG